MDFVATVVEHWQNNNKTKLFGVLLGIIWGAAGFIWGAAEYLGCCLVLFGVVLDIIWSGAGYLGCCWVIFGVLLYIVCCCKINTM